MPEDLRARVEERVFVQTEIDQLRQIVPDLYVKELHPAPAAGAPDEGGIAVAEPTVFLLEAEQITEGYIEIRERGGGKVVTVIELLSPANKSGGEGEKLYLQKQQESLHSEMSLVEIDLVRSGHRVLAFPQHCIPPEHRSDSLVCVRCASIERERWLYFLPLRERLPTIRIPLRRGEKPVPLDLQALLDQCYHNGRYDDLDYSQEPIPPLGPEDALWAEGVLRAAGKR